MRIQTRAEWLKVGDVVFSTDNRRWTIDDLRVNQLLTADRYTIFAHNGDTKKQFILKFSAQILIERKKKR
jgi:hypothetical protein